MTNIQAIDLLKGLEQSLDDYCELNDEGKTAFHMAITALEVFGNSEQLPSAQPERTDKHTETHACDCISRQGAIDALGGNEPVGDPSKMDDDDVVKMWERIRIINIINKLPSVQPYTDEEIQKIQELEQTQLDKAFDLGREDAKAEIVRCKDCRHSEHWYRDKLRCFLWHEEGIDVFEDGFCNYAERRADGRD